MLYSLQTTSKYRLGHLSQPGLCQAMVCQVLAVIAKLLPQKMNSHTPKIDTLKQYPCVWRAIFNISSVINNNNISIITINPKPHLQTLSPISSPYY